MSKDVPRFTHGTEAIHRWFIIWIKITKLSKKKLQSGPRFAANVNEFRWSQAQNWAKGATFYEQQRPRYKQSSSSDSTNNSKLYLSIRNKKAGGSQQVEESAGNGFKTLFEHYDRHRIRRPQFDMFFDALCSIQSTSTKCERNFSLAASLATLKRNRLSSEKLSAICFLKRFFKFENQ